MWSIAPSRGDAEGNSLPRNEGRPLLDVGDALKLVTSKLGKYLDPWAKPNHPADVRRALHTNLKRDAALNASCGTMIPAEGLFDFAKIAAPEK